jgi:hypothetical protein
MPVSQAVRSVGEERVGAEYKAPCPQLDQIREYTIEITFGLGFENVKLDPKGLNRRQWLARYQLGNCRIGRIGQERFGEKLVEQIRPLRSCLHQLSHAR